MVETTDEGKIHKVGRVSSASVLKCTGKDWESWVKILKTAGATHWTHPEIVAFLKKKYKLGPWWQQGVTSGFEMVIGRKQLGRSSKGEYSMTSSITLPRSTTQLWKMLLAPHGQKLWLKPFSAIQLKSGAAFETEGGIYGEVRTWKAGVRLRLSWRESEWPKASIVQVQLIARSKDKCILVFQHDGLKDARLKEQMRAHWQAALQRIRQHLTN
jgi:hypothetical protein